MSSTTTTLRLLVTRPASGAAVDVAVTVGVLVVSLVLISHGGLAALRPGSSPADAADLDPVGVVLVTASSVPLLAWRRSPLGVFTATGLASVLLAGLGYPFDLALGPAVALYLLATSREPHAPWTRGTTLTVVGLFGAYLVATAASQQAVPSVELLHSGLAWAAAWFAGERTRLRHQHIADLRERARRAEHDAQRDRLLAVATERARIARDLHDSAGHAISVIAVRAGAARLRHHESPERSLTALAAIEDLARKTADEVDQIVGTLRDSGQPTGAVEAPHGLASVDTLLTQHRAAGLEVTFDAVGTPRPLSPAADQAVYRILQESLTNATRHGAGNAKVQLVYRDACIELTVTNLVLAEGASRSGGGHGLIGMHERAVVLGGSLDAGRHAGTFRVQARIPDGSHHP